MEYIEQLYPCPVCDSMDFSPIYTKGDEACKIRNGGKKLFHKEIVMCNSCSLVQTNPRLSQESIEDFYKTQYRISYKGGDLDFESIGLELRNGIMRMDWFGKHLNIDGFKVLDVGNSTGITSSLFFDKTGIKVDGIEPGEEGRKTQKTLFNYSPFPESFEKFNGKYEYYDLIAFFDVLEHFFNPVDIIKKARTLLKDNGYLFIEIPEIGYYYPVFHQDVFFTSAHNTFFSKTIIANILQQNGFNVLNMENAGQKSTLLIIAQKSDSIIHSDPFADHLMDDYNSIKNDVTNYNTIFEQINFAIHIKEHNVSSSILWNIYQNSDFYRTFQKIFSTTLMLRRRLIDDAMEFFFYDKTVPLIDISNDACTIPDYYYLNAYFLHFTGDIITAIESLKKAEALFPHFEKYSTVYKLQKMGFFNLRFFCESRMLNYLNCTDMINSLIY
ncbi:MAG: class I SAM-dependent methyltransferase [Thermodesulfobacteriota bacterium]|nr:class I SAM-dependent methyltransferase [Thermodesulfobacteriota bacterium]